MLRKEDIYHVSIRELCERADVNRTTFYKYYGNQFDLLADMENDLLVFLSDTIREYETNPVKIIETTCAYMEGHLEFGRLIVDDHVPLQGVRRSKDCCHGSGCFWLQGHERHHHGDLPQG